MTEVYEGICHCGAVRFRIAGAITEITTCDCSLCRRRNALMTMVHESAFTLLAGDAALTEYRWNTGIARHYFCSACGTYTFHRKRALPDHYGINVFCLEGFDPSAVPVRATVGAGMTVDAEGALAHWPGPRVAD